MDLGGPDPAYFGAHLEGAGQVEDCKNLENYAGEGCSRQVSTLLCCTHFGNSDILCVSAPSLHATAIDSPHTKLVIDLGFCRQVLDGTSLSRS